jgi:excisionase family DNA binding protein
MPANHPERITRKPGRAEWKQLAAWLTELWPHDEYTAIVTDGWRQDQPWSKQKAGGDSVSVVTAAPDESEPAGLLLTVQEAARRLRIGRTLIYQLISSGELESVKVGRLRRVPAECLPEYVAALRGTRSSEAADGNSAAWGRRAGSAKEPGR